MILNVLALIVMIKSFLGTFAASTVEDEKDYRKFDFQNFAIAALSLFLFLTSANMKEMFAF